MIQRLEARTLSSKKEWNVIESSLPPVLGTLSVFLLKNKIVRARKLRGNYQDLYRRQKLSSKSTMTGRPQERLNVRTQRKKQMFNEALGRLQVQLENVAEPRRTSSRRPARKRAASRMAKTGSTSRDRTRSRKAGVKSQTSPVRPKLSARKAAEFKRRHAQISAAMRRHQSRVSRQRA
jgi:hypothetical protein